MKYRYLFLVFITLTTSFVYYQYTPPDDSLDLTNKAPTSSTNPTTSQDSRDKQYLTRRASAPPPNLDTAKISGAKLESNVPVDWQAMRKRYDLDYDPMVFFTRPFYKFTDKEITAYNELHVIEFNQVSGWENCPGTANEESCVVWKYLRHPYYELNDEELTDLAETDAAAAVILGKRLYSVKTGLTPEHEVTRMNWFLRAVALSGKSGPLIELGQEKYNTLYVDGEPMQSEIAIRIALEDIAQRLRDPRAEPSRWNKALSEMPDYEKWLDHANEAEGVFINQMASIQETVTGSDQIARIFELERI